MVGRNGNVHSGEVETQGRGGGGGGVRELVHNLGSAEMCSRKKHLVPGVSVGLSWGRWDQAAAVRP